MATSRNLSKAKVKSRTSLSDYAPWLDELERSQASESTVVIGGHAANYWLELYREQHEVLQQWSPKPGRDLDILVTPKLVADLFMKDDTYEPAATFVTDLFFFSARRFILRQRLTPLSLWFILRAGKIAIPHADGKHALHVDFFAHSLGYHPNYVRQRAVKGEMDGNHFLVTDPVQCLWSFLANASTLHQTQGDSGPRRRIDHERTVILFHITQIYLLELADLSGAGDEPARAQLAQALEDLAHFLRSNPARDQAETLGLDWQEIIPTDFFDRLGTSPSNLVEAAKKVKTVGGLEKRRHGLFPRKYPKPAPTFEASR